MQQQSTQSSKSYFQVWKALALITLISLPIFSGLSAFTIIDLIDVKWAALAMAGTLLLSVTLPVFPPKEIRFGSDHFSLFSSIFSKHNKIDFDAKDWFLVNLKNTDEREILEKYKAVAFGHMITKAILVFAIFFQIIFIYQAMDIDFERKSLLATLLISMIPLSLHSLLPLMYLSWIHESLDTE